MAHNALVHGGVGSGSWNALVLAGTDFELLDQRQFEAINGDLGGTWAPAAVITIGGLGLTTTGPMVTSGTFTANAAATFASNVTLQAPSSVWNTMTVDGAHTGEIFFNATAQLVGAATSVFSWAGTFTAAAATFTGTVAFNGGVQIASATNVSAAFDVLNTSTFTFDVGSTVTMGTYMALGASSAGIKWRYLAGPDADTTIAAGTYDIIRIGPITGAANRNYTLSNAVEGIAILITMVQAVGSGTNTVTIKDGGGASIVVLKFQQAGQIEKVLMVYHSAAWIVADYELYAIT